MSKSEIFRKSSLDRISSPEKLNDYIKVSNPSVWVVIVALLIMLASAFIWAVVGKLPTTVQKAGVFSGKNLEDKNTDYVTCFLSESDITGEQQSSNDKESGTKEDVAAIKAGQRVEISPTGSNSKKDGVINGVIEQIFVQPITVEEISAQLGILAAQVVPSGYAYKALVKVGKSGGSFSWSKGRAPENIKIESGSMCRVNVFTEEIKAIDFITN